MRHVGFSDQSQRHALYVDQTTQDAHHHMCFRQAHAGSANSLPQIRDCIESNIAGTVSGIKKQYSGELHEHVGIGKVHVYLVFAEGGPDALYALSGMYLSQQRRVTRTQHLPKQWVEFLLMEIVFAWGSISYVIRKPNVLAGTVVDHQIDHQVKSFGQVLNIWPVAQVRAHAFVVDHGKPIVRGGREKRQNMNAAHNTIKIGTREPSKALQWHRVGPLEAVTVAYQYRLGAGRREGGR